MSRGMTTMEDTMSQTISAQVYWDVSDPQERGWAYRYTTADGVNVSNPLTDVEAEDVMGAAQAAWAEIGEDVDELIVYTGEQKRLRYAGEDDYRYL